MNQVTARSRARPRGTKIAVTPLALLALFGASAAQAGIVKFNAAGTGLSEAIAATSAINAHGSGFVVVQPDQTNPSSLVFSETGAYQLTQADGVSPIGANDITLTYSVMGSVNPLTGAISFSGGAFSLYSDTTWNFGSTSSDPGVVFGANDGTLIASFLVSSGGGTANGSVNMTGTAVGGSVLPGYFFSALGDDLSLSSDLQFVVDIGNIIDPSPSSTVISELVCKAAGFPGPGCNGSDYANTPYYFVVKDGASATLSTTIPEPGSAALLFAGVAGLGFFGRRPQKRA